MAKLKKKIIDEDPNVWLYSADLKKKGIKCGKNCKVHATTIITHPKKLQLGNNVRIDAFCLLVSLKGIFLKNFVHVGPYAMLHAGKDKIFADNHTGISSGTKIYTHQDDYSGEFYYGPGNKIKSGLISKIMIPKFAILGTNCVVVPGAKIATGVAIGANCLVAQKLKPWKIYQGFPLKAYFNRKKTFVKKFKLK